MIASRTFSKNMSWRGQPIGPGLKNCTSSDDAPQSEVGKSHMTLVRASLADFHRSSSAFLFLLLFILA